jgi:hypothetical protein
LDAIRDEADRCLAVVQNLAITDTHRKAWDLRCVDEETRQLSAPWYDEALWALRHEAFIAALGLHKVFLQANAVQVTDNLKFLSKVMIGAETERGISFPMRKLWDTLFLAVPMVSTAFASVPRLFSPLGAEELGWLIIDEAGQATPQAALGSIWRARRSVVVGDPLQLEPVVSMPEAAIEMIRQKFDVGQQWHPVAHSAQVLADRSNKWGTFLGDGADGPWLGSPLRVHRRCDNPMFRVANQIAYGGMMVYGTNPGEDEEDPAWLRESAWLDVGSDGAEGHWIPAQGVLAARIVRAVILRKGATFTEDGKANIYVISPFKAAADGIKDMLKAGRRSDAAVDAARHANRIAGTVHTFQGKEADTVVLLLGGDPAKPGARIQLCRAGAKPAECRAHTCQAADLRGRRPSSLEQRKVLQRACRRPEARHTEAVVQEGLPRCQQLRTADIDGLQGDAVDGYVTQIVRQDVIPADVVSFHCDRTDSRVERAPCAGAPIGWPPVADRRRWLLGRTSRAIAGLAVGVAERVLLDAVEAPPTDPGVSRGCVSTRISTILATR